MKKVTKMPKEWRENISKALKGKGIGRKHSMATRKKISLIQIGKKASDETKKRMSRTHKTIGTGKWMKGRLGEKGNAWKGDDVGYRGIHYWIEQYLGVPNYCQICHSSPEKKKKRRVQWANRSGRYMRDVSDWIALCVPCHMKFDRNHLSIPSPKL